MPTSEMKRHIHTLDVIKVVLLLTGIGLSSAYVLLSFQASAVQARLKRQFEQDITHQQDRAHFERGDRSPQLQTHAGGLAKLDIPKAGISAMVIEGTDDATLRVAVGHIQGTALPGQAGNVGLARANGERHAPRHSSVVCGILALMMKSRSPLEKAFSITRLKVFVSHRLMT